MTYKPVYFDNAASSFPKPECVIESVRRHLLTNTSNPGRSGHFLSAAASDTVFSVRREVAEVFGCLPEDVIFTQNATHALNLLFFGLLRQGDHVLISDREHNSVVRPLVALARRGITFDIVKTEAGEPDDVRFERRITPDTKLIFCTHASNVTGRTFDIAALAKTAHRHGLLFGTDASQTAGHTTVNMTESGIDFLCTAGHKGLFGIQGSGVLICRENASLCPLLYGGNGIRSLETDMGDALPERLEAGTLNTPAIVSLGEGIRFLRNTENEIRNHEKELTGQLLSVLKNDPRVTLLDDPTGDIPVLSFTFDGKTSEEVVGLLSDKGICARGGFHCARLTHLSLHTENTGAVRLSPGFFNTADDVGRFAEILEKI